MLMGRHWYRLRSSRVVIGLTFRAIEVEAGNIGTAGQLDADRKPAQAGVGVKLGELLAYLAGADSDDGVAAGVITYGAAEHLGADHSFAEAFVLPIQGVANYEAEEILSALTAGKGSTGKDGLNVAADYSRLIRSKDRWFMERRRTGCRHYSSRILTRNYTTEENPTAPSFNGTGWVQRDGG
jgi:hypothetical protein